MVSEDLNFARSPATDERRGVDSFESIGKCIENSSETRSMQQDQQFPADLPRKLSECTFQVDRTMGVEECAPKWKPALARTGLWTMVWQARLMRLPTLRLRLDG